MFRICGAERKKGVSERKNVCFRDLQKGPLKSLVVYTWKTLWRWGKEPTEISGLHNPGVNTGLGKCIPPDQNAEGPG